MVPAVAVTSTSLGIFSCKVGKFTHQEASAAKPPRTPNSVARSKHGSFLHGD